MDENNRKGPGVFYAVIGVATLVVAIIGATFAFFSAQATAEGDTITGTTNTVGGSLSLNVEKVEFEGVGEEVSNDLVPADLTADAAGIGRAITANCVDEGYTGCHLYKITASSTQDIQNASIKLSTLTVDAKDTASWKYVVYKSADGEKTTVTSVVNEGGTSFSDFASEYAEDGYDMHQNGSLTESTPVYYYLLIYLANKEEDIQNPEDKQSEHSGEGTYNGTISMDVLGGKVVASFAAEG